MYTLGGGVIITVTLGDGCMSTYVCGGDVVSVTDTLIYGRAFAFTSIRVKMWDCSVGGGGGGGVVGSWRMALYQVVGCCGESLKVPH